MTRNLAILAALALGVFAFSNVFSLAVPQPSSAYEDSFGFSPRDDDGFDAEWRKAGAAVIRAAKDQRRKWYTVRLVVEGDG